MNEHRKAQWSWAGPVARAYGLSQLPLAVIVGPTGGGKTTETVRRILRAAQWQDPSPRDGLRKIRICIICTTYRRLWDQFTPSYFKEIDREWGVEGPGGKSGFTGAKGDPWDHRFTVQLPDGTTAYVEVMGRAVGDSDLEDFFRGLEVTAFIIPEMDTHANDDILSGAQNRVGRYPEPDDRPEPDPNRPAAYAGVWADSNAPVIGSWFHKRFYLNRKKGEVFVQPGGRSAHAENLHNLRKINPRYYDELAKRMEKKWAILRFVDNKPGYSRHGEPVHEHFDSERMVALEPILAEPGFPIVVGCDSGDTLKPAAVFLQRVAGQIRVLEEVTSVGQMDLVEFAGAIKRIRETRFANFKNITLVVDPAAAAPSAMNRFKTMAMELAGHTGLDVDLAPTNSPALRRTAVDQVLKRSGLPGEPGFLVGNNCPGIIEALAGGYRFKRMGDKVAEVPDKGPHSHVADALQYGILGLEGLGVGGGFIHDGGAQGHSEDHRAILQE